MKKGILSIVLLAGSIICCSCKGNKVSSNVTKDEKFGSAVVALSKEEFESNGYKLGDSFDIKFQNGYVIEDVPYYNGYYVKNEYPVVVAYPGSSNIAITYNNAGIWDKANLNDGDKVTFKLHESGKYSAIQDSLGQVYSFNRNDYSSDVEFSNFRQLGGKVNSLYRGASPVDNSRGRASITNSLLEKNSINVVIDLADSKDDMDSYIAASDFNSTYTKALYDNNKVLLLDMGSAYQSLSYKKSVAEACRFIVNNSGNVYIHCMEGKDRTGFVCMLFEALAGSSYDEMLSDYMTTYTNYYKVTSDKTPEKYSAIADLYFNSFMSFLHGTEDITVLKNTDYVSDAKSYLKDGGLTDKEISDFILRIK